MLDESAFTNKKTAFMGWEGEVLGALLVGIASFVIVMGITVLAIEITTDANAVRGESFEFNLR